MGIRAAPGRAASHQRGEQQTAPQAGVMRNLNATSLKLAILVVPVKIP